MKRYLFASAEYQGIIRQPFVATCAKCHRTIYFDIDPDGTPGFNGDWGDGEGDYGCAIDNGDDSEDGNGHVPASIRYDRRLYPRPTAPPAKESACTRIPNECIPYTCDDIDCPVHGERNRTWGL